MHDDHTTRTAESLPTQSAPETFWPVWQRWGFRFLAVYFLLYTFPFPLSFMPWMGEPISQDVTQLWQRAAVWVGNDLLGMQGEIYLGPTGSGDTTYDYLRLLMVVVLAISITLLWSILDRRRSAYPRLARWLIVGARFYLGIFLIAYGTSKVIPTQFTTPPLASLLQTYGSSSPMRLAWTFMGLSPAYTMFAGWMELIPGLLLLLRRTRLLGACLALAVMSNVAMINYCFDVPVKLFSTHLLLIAVALLLLDGRRLWSLFLGNRPAPAAELPPLFSERRWQKAAVLLASLMIASVLWDNLSRGFHIYNNWGGGRPRPELWGIHDVQTFRLDGEELPPLRDDSRRWQALVIDHVLPIRFGDFERPGRVAVQAMDGSVSYLPVDYDEEEGVITFLPPGQSNVQAVQDAGGEIEDVLRIERIEPGRMILRGRFRGQQLETELHARDLEEMLLISRGYHWINETPFNR